jgi:toxin ParE1/3/4
LRRADFTGNARTDLNDIFEYLAHEMASSEQARVVIDRIEAQCRKIASLHTQIGRARPELGVNLRSFPFQSWIIFFRYLADSVEIVNIIHSARDIDALFNPADD